MNASLFNPIPLGRGLARNRVAMAPMTRSRADEDGTPVRLMGDYYEQRAGAGLVVSEAVNISAQAQGFLKVPGIFNSAQERAWAPIVARVQARQSLFFMQLWHVGRIAHPDNMAPGLHPVAPSALQFNRTIVTRRGALPLPTPHPLSDAEVEKTIADYAAAARRAVEAGCDGVEIHAANGYLPSQFLHESSNQRSRPWGGSLEARARFIFETTAACSAAIGADRTALRLSPFSAFNGAESTDEAAVYEHLLHRLAALPLAYLHVVRTEVSGNQTVERPDLVDVLAFVRPRWPHRLVCAGNYGAMSAVADVAQGRTDLVAFGRDFIANPDLVERLRAGAPLAVRNPAEWYGSGAEGYTDYPAWTTPS